MIIDFSVILIKYRCRNPARHRVRALMDPQVLSLVRSLGVDLTPPMIQGTQQFFAERVRGVGQLTSITRDQSYGPHDRHRLDLFTTDLRRDAPVLVFVHGGGFVMGDKRTTGLPFLRQHRRLRGEVRICGRHHDIPAWHRLTRGPPARRCGCRSSLVTRPRGRIRRRPKADFF